MTARTDQVRSLADGGAMTLVATECSEGEKALIAAGELADFRCCYGTRQVTEGGIALVTAAMLRAASRTG